MPVSRNFLHLRDVTAPWMLADSVGETIVFSVCGVVWGTTPAGPADDGYRFSKWAGDCSGAGDCALTMDADKSAGGANCSVTLTADRSVGATFAVRAQSGDGGVVGVSVDSRSIRVTGLGVGSTDVILATGHGELRLPVVVR